MVMDTNVWNRFSKLRRSFRDNVVKCRRYYFCFSISAAFMSGLVTCYHLNELAVGGVLTTYLFDSLNSPTGRSHLALIAATMNKVHGGLTSIFEVIFTFISDSHIGGFKTLLISSAFYITGVTILVFWGKIPYSGRLFFNTIAIFCLAIGCGGKQLLREFLSEQLRAKEPAGREPIDERRVRARTRVWYRAAWLIAAVVATFGISGWSITFPVLASAMALSYLVFFICGILFYHRKEATNRKHDLEDTETSTVTIEKTSSFRQLMQQCTSKSLIKFVLPTWGFYIILGVGISTADTFFQWQAEDLKFPFDITALLLLKSISGREISFLFDIIVPKPADGETTGRGEIMRSWIEIWIGMLLMVASLLVGWRVDAYWHTYGNDTPHLALWLSLQFFLFGSAETLAEDGLSDLLDDHLQNYGPSLNGFAAEGLGNFLSIILLQIMRRWFPSDLNGIRLDKYYLLVAILNFLNLSSSILWVFYGGMDRFAVEEQAVCVGQSTSVDTQVVDGEQVVDVEESIEVVASMAMVPVREN